MRTILLITKCDTDFAIEKAGLWGNRMAYDEQLATRVRKLLKRRKNYSERKMFGGICFMLGGNMCCGVTTDAIMLRLGRENAETALEEPFTREMDFTGRPMKGMIYVDAGGYAADDDLKDWVQQAAKFAASLPVKVK